MNANNSQVAVVAQANANVVEFADGSKHNFGKRGLVVKVVRVEDETITFYFKDRRIVVVEAGTFSADIRAIALMHGFSQKLGDAYAGVEGDVGKAYDRLTSAVTALQQGWRVHAEKADPDSDLIEAIVEAFGTPEDEVIETVKGLSKAEKTCLRGVPEVKAILDRMASERAQKLAPKVDMDAVIGKFRK